MVGLSHLAVARVNGLWRGNPQAHRSSQAEVRRPVILAILEQPEGLAVQKPWDLWFENRIYPSPNGLTIYFTEMTERKRAEAALRESEARLRPAVGAANVGLWDWNLRTNQIYSSPEWKR
ncbi:MAG: hypothetical protein AB1806_02530 [Acidobacteriota bacterium]